MKDIKLKDYKYQIHGVNSPRSLNECLAAIALMAVIPIIISLIIYFADKIDAIDNFFQAFFVVIIFVGIGLVKLWKMK